MKTAAKLIVINLVFLISLSINSNAQSFEVPTGPFGDSTNYVPPTIMRTINSMKGATYGASSIINIINYKQCDQLWANSNLGACTSSICQSGCAMTAASILLKANGINVDPGQLNTWLKNNGGYSGGCDLYWTAITNYPGATLTWYKSNTYSLSILRSEIDGGNPVLVHVDHRYGDIGTCSHFVVVYGYNNSGTTVSDFLVSDPGTVTCPSDCNLSYYTICTSDIGNAPLRIYHNVSSIPLPTPPTNDNCPGTSITSNDASKTGTVAGATGSYGANQCTGCSCKSPDDYDVYYNFTAQATSHTVTVSNYASNFDAVIELRTACASGSAISCYDPSGSPTSVSYTWDNLTIGQTYYIRVFEYDFSGTPPSSPTFEISVTHSSSAATASISNVSFSSSVNNGEAFDLDYTIEATGSINVILGASIRRNGQDYSDPSNDDLTSLNSNMSNYRTRSFDLSVATPNPIPAGLYDVIVALWSDLNGNGVIDPSTDVSLSSFTSSQQLTINSGCSYSLSQTSQNFSYSGGSGSFTINATANSDCDWDVNLGSTNGCGLVNITSLENGKGPYTITYDVAQNSTNYSQTCTLTVSSSNGYKQDYVITQDANPTCNAIPNPATANYSSDGGLGSFNIDVGQGCFWNITNSCSSMLTNINPTDGYGPAKVTYTVLPNISSSIRSCSFHVQQNNKSHKITQQGICTAPTSPTSASASQTTITSGQSTTLQEVGGVLNSASDWIWYTGDCGDTPIGNGATLPVSPTVTTTYYVQASACTTATTCISVKINVNCAIPSQPGTISGNTTVCQSSSNTYSIGAVSGATSYTWTLPSGWSGSSTTTSITATVGSAGGTISVTANNSCGSSTPITLSVTVSPVPTQPGTISGNATVCQSSSNTYSIGAVSGATSYTWTLPSGWSGSSTTTSITATAGSSGGTISVTANNSCGSSTPRTLSITVYIKPNTPLISLNGYVLHSDASSGNQWYNQNGFINGATNQNYTVTTNGDYYVIVTLFGCSSESSNTINVVLTGIEVVDNDQTIKVYPNPFSNELIVEIEGNNEKINFEILNSIGQIVYIGNLIEKTIVQTNNFAPGVYLVRFENGKTFEFKKIIKK